MASLSRLEAPFLDITSYGLNNIVHTKFGQLTLKFDKDIFLQVSHFPYSTLGMPRPNSLESHRFTS